ncbi:MAG: hypothetical protein WBF58_12750 [Xanthobacteraceae bacterium]
MCRQGTEFSSGRSRACGRAERARLITASLTAIVLGITLCGCSDFYFDRRDTISLGAGDAIAANAAGEIIDPWPPHSGDTNIAANGQRMQAAVERYRNDRVTPPVDAMAAQATTASQSNSQSPTATAGAAPTAPTPSTLVIAAPSQATTASE